MKIQAISNYIIVEKVKQEEKTKTGLVKAESNKKMSDLFIGKVISAENFPTGFQIICFSYQTTPFNFEGKEFFLIKYEDIFGKVK